MPASKAQFIVASAHSLASDVTESQAVTAKELLARARTVGAPEGFHFSGVVTPRQAWALFEAGLVELIDVRTQEELNSVGYVPRAQHVAWATGPRMVRNPHFLDQLSVKVAKDSVILFLCRSGKRSQAAAEAASHAGFEHVFNIAEGFEGESVAGQSGTVGGWRSYDLPWSNGSIHN
ncbi:rhodanese-like domain-containing protein [Ferriphaselus sp. R-1]|uniref:rhodanese-like domain-containing protein n=1 Tax=Ferriphaselus sp. R-1 TaxID=1485544 RepID=UPI0009DF5577|nr:rhodanese-like domain-containing protein [Ferriphaselus sp. R-1]